MKEKRPCYYLKMTIKYSNKQSLIQLQRVVSTIDLLDLVEKFDEWFLIQISLVLGTYKDVIVTHRT